MRRRKKAVHIGQLIAELRKEMGYSQRRLAKLSGVSYSLVSLIERGLRCPGAVSLNGISNALHVSVEAILNAGDWDSIPATSGCPICSGAGLVPCPHCRRAATKTAR